MENPGRKNKIRVMHFVTGWLDKIYGGEAAALAIIRGTDKDKFYCVMACFKDPRAPLPPPIIDEAKRSGIAAEVIYIKWRFDIFAVSSLKKLLLKYDIDILHCHGYKADVIGYLTSRFTKVALVSTCHGWWPNTLKLKIYDLIDMAVLRCFDKVIAVSPKIYENLKKKGIGPPRSEIILNGIDIGRFEVTAGREKIRQDLGIKKECFVVGSVGRLSGEKGIKYLLEAAAMIRAEGIRFVIVGEGDSKKDLISYAGELNISDKVIFTGYREDVAGMLSVFDVYVMPSLTEGLPISLLEAMAAGKPVIASNVGGIPMVVEHGKTGILVEPGDASGIEKAISGLMGNKAYSDVLAANGRRSVEDKFSIAATVRKYEEVYSKALENG